MTPVLPYNPALTPAVLAAAKAGGSAMLARKLERTRSNRSIGGRKANRAGDAFERSIQAGTRDHNNTSLCALIEWPKSGGRFVGAGKMKAVPIAFDRSGTICGTGRHICFDCKSCDDPYGIALNRDNILKPHQAAELLRQRVSGAVAGLLVEAHRIGEYLWLDGRELGPQRAYLAWASPIWLHLGKTTHHVDFGKLIAAYAGRA